MSALKLVYSRAEAELVAKRAIEAIQPPVEISGISIHTSPSIGIAFYPADGSRHYTLPATADNVQWGWYDPNEPPKLHLHSGDAVSIETLSHSLGQIKPGVEPPRSSLALNDVVLQKQATGRMLDFETSNDGRFVNAHGGDGLVAATSTGSTAYALSCGGPIMTPDVDALVLAPISAHTLSDRPIVVSRRSRIEVRLVHSAPIQVQVVCDGVVLGDLSVKGRLTIGPSDERVTLLHPPGYDYYRILRSKLHWGRSARHRDD